MALNVVMLGAPGAGKGTQGERFAKQHGVPRISTGDILRQGIKDNLPVAMVAKAKMDRGELVDDETIMAIVQERLSRPDTATGFVLDGFPRTLFQARALEKLVEDRGNGPLIVVDIVVPEEELVRRLGGRRICSKCGENAGPDDGDACRRCGGHLIQRADDSEAVVRERLRVYHGATAPLVDFYRGRPTFRTVNGAQAPDLVARELDATVQAAASEPSAGAQRSVGR